MTRYEYKVRPAPTKGQKAPGIKGPEARFAHGLELVMNEMGADGWDYVRSDILPSEERQGLTSTQTVYRSVLVFRRPIEDDMAEPSAPPLITEPEEAEPDLPAEVVEAVQSPEGEMPVAENEPDSPPFQEDADEGTEDSLSDTPKDQRSD